MIPFVSTSAYPVRSGNRVTPLIDGEPAFRRICELIDAARQRVWVTVTFLWASFELPGERGSLFDVLDSAATRGLDVRVIFWRPDEETAWLRSNAFWGCPAHLNILGQHHSALSIRWDRALPGFCQHQKSWLIDETALVGGINLNPNSVVMPGHHGEGQNHDMYIELAGPAVTDVACNFVQRWNGYSEYAAAHGSWGTGSGYDLCYSDQLPGPQGDVNIQVQRTHGSEHSIFDQYCTAINAAQRSIYIENQHIEVPEIINQLQKALSRGVQIVLLMPAGSHPALQKLSAFSNFLLAGISGISVDGTRKPVHVHSKLMLIDDEWATAGSSNLHRFSLFGNSELNVSFANPAAVKTLRCALFAEHLDQDTSRLNDVEALHLFGTLARANRSKADAGDPGWQGLVYKIM